MQVATGEHVDRYVVEGVLGEGGMSTVYRVRDAERGTVHALKLLGHVHRSVRDRLALEGRVQLRLRHPNLVAVTAVVVHHGQSALVMDLVDGPPLSALLRRHRFDPAQVDVLARRILAGVAHAHTHACVHRDLKPANVLVAIDGDDLVPKVTDFGLAKVLDPSDAGDLTRTGAAMGTPAYMSPEQMRNSKDVDARADVYSLGVLLYELLCGRRPYTGDELVDLHAKAAAGGFERPETIVPGLPRRMAEAIGAALSPDRLDRPADAGALLERWTAGTSEETVSARTGELWGPVLSTARELAGELAPTGGVGEQSRASSGTLATFSGPSGVDPSAPTVRTRGVRPFVRVAGLALAFLFAIGVGLSTTPLWMVGSVESVPMRTLDAAPLPLASPQRSEPPAAAAPPAVVDVPSSPADVAPGAGITAVGDATVELRSAGTARPPGPVDPGRYEVWAAFDAGPPVHVLDVEVAAGDRVVVRCRGDLRACSVDAP